MGEKIVIGPGINRGFRNDVEPFHIDNDSFPELVNAYQWRGRIKRKRGTTPLGRLQREVTLTASPTLGSGWYNLLGLLGLTPQSIFITNISQATSAVVTYNYIGGLDYSIGQIVQIVAVGGMTEINGGYYTITNKAGNQLTLNVDSTNFSAYTVGGVVAVAPNQSIVLGSINFVDGALNTYTEPSTPDGTLLKNGIVTANQSIFYQTGIIVLNLPAAISGTFNYYPALPVEGLEDLILPNTEFPETLGFDTTYSYNIPTASPYTPYDVSFYKNPQTGPVGYVPKGSQMALTWNGNDYQQFWSTNYQGAFWITNGVDIPFTGTKVGMQFKLISAIGGVVGGPPAFATITTTANHGLVVGDFVFINEVSGLTGINFQTGYVTVVPAANQITVEFPNATFAGAYTTGGIVQFLTNRSDTTKDCIRWYDGDPTVVNSSNGWVNFCPPLSQSIYSIADLPQAQYYLVGARLIAPFKDRLLFFGPVVQTSTGTPIYLQDTIIYSQNGTPYYTCSFTGNALLANTVFNPILVPTNQTATANSWWEDQTGFGGFISAGLNKPITTVGNNQDVIIIDIGNSKARVVYTGNDIVPFNIFIINSELGEGSTFSTVTLDQGVVTKGQKGFVICNQTSAQRIDLDIPDQVFQINLTNNGAQRVCAQRDFINEWIYFTYPADDFSYVYPNQTLQYNYRDQSWGLFNESYTTYGQFRPSSGYTWLTIPFSWQTWNSPWTSGDSNLEQPYVIAGNQQGFIVFRDSDTTNEAPSLFIQAISGATITCPNHCLNNGDYVLITDTIGLSNINNTVFKVLVVNDNTIKIDGNPTGTYIGGGVITRLYNPFISTKQFPVAWNMARKTRLGPQQYLLTQTPAGQIQLLIYLSQNDSNPFNDTTLIANSSLIYSTILYTCRESTNLGLTTSNSNLLQLNAIDFSQNPVTSSNNQNQIWHRINTSLIGDTIQVAFTMSDAQMRSSNSNMEEIELHSFILDVNPGPLLA